ncbi:hypothetical protein ANCDUO_11642 [Ancylostoma duodenale]|uniref:Laminin G domain-containing protein n=1 Tax=Ancylostoma duodenale TaxID=51022 RepID=A0A0C2GH17_9BILA|nr:hypothetical protein ANCDUO_11642 [Ancylostoma duodenale]
MDMRNPQWAMPKQDQKVKTVEDHAEDGITTYSCQCVMGFSGQFCEIPPMGNALYPNTAQCHSLLCGHKWPHRVLRRRQLHLCRVVRRRIKIAFYIGNYPASHMYSYVTVNDGLAHRIEILVKGKKCTLSIDNQKLQSIENDGKLEKFLIDTKQYLYIGGLPADRAARVKSMFHVKESHSFKGRPALNFIGLQSLYVLLNTINPLIKL